MGHEHPQGAPWRLPITLRLDAQEGRRWEDGRLIQEASVPISTLILGGSVRITTPQKRIQIEVPERTKIGDRRRVTVTATKEEIWILNSSSMKTII